MDVIIFHNLQHIIDNEKQGVSNIHIHTKVLQDI